jgi:hypothetical protein
MEVRNVIIEGDAQTVIKALQAEDGQPIENDHIFMN